MLGLPPPVFAGLSRPDLAAPPPSIPDLLFPGRSVADNALGRRFCFPPFPFPAVPGRVEERVKGGTEESSLSESLMTDTDTDSRRSFSKALVFMARVSGCP